MTENIKEMFCQPFSERAILSYCFKDVNNYHSVLTTINTEDFLRPEHQLIWVIMGTLARQKIAGFDIPMVVAEAQRSQVLDKIGGYEYLTAIINMNLVDSNIEYYVNKVLDASTKFQLFLKLQYNLNKVEDAATNEDKNADSLLGMVTTDVLELSLKSKIIKEATNLSDGVDEYLETQRNNPVELCGLNTGFAILDKRIDGLVPGTLTVVCARPKNGKSTFLSNIGAYVAYSLGKPVLYIDTEMPFDQWRPRILSLLSGVAERKIKHGGYTDQEYYNLTKAAKIIKKGKFFHEYMPGYSIDKLNAIYKKYKHIENIGLAIFDYIKAPSSADFRNKKEHQILGDVTTALKDLSGELDIPFLCANQINRQQDIADSDRILRYADVLMFLKKKSLEEIQEAGLKGGTYKLIVSDSRRGGTTPEAGIGFNFYKSTLQLSEAEIQVIDYFKYDNKETEDIEYDDESF